MPTAIRVLIADDHDLILEIISLVLENTPDIRPSIARSIAEVADKITLHGAFDLVLLDLDMPGMLGVATLRTVRRMNDGRPVGIFTGATGPGIVTEMDQAGAAGVVPKTISMRSLINAIRFMAAGERYFPLEVMRDVAPTSDGAADPIAAQAPDEPPAEEPLQAPTLNPSEALPRRRDLPV